MTTVVKEQVQNFALMMEDPKKKALAPLSLSLVAKKMEILQTEVTKLETRVRQRTEILCRLRQSHENLLTTNGHLQERNRLRQEKLIHLHRELDGSHMLAMADDGALSSGDGVELKELEISTSKTSVLHRLLAMLSDKSIALEGESMKLEEELLRKTDYIQDKLNHLGQVEETILLHAEDVLATEWRIEIEEKEIMEAEARMNLASQRIEREHHQMSQSTKMLEAEQHALCHVEMVRQNHRGMATEEQDQLIHTRHGLQSTIRELLSLLDRRGATCAEDEEIEAVSTSLAQKLKELNETMTAEKYLAREIILRAKQEKKLLAITNAAIKSKEDQLSWLERQRIYHCNEYNQLQNELAANESAYNEAVSRYKREIESTEKEYQHMVDCIEETKCKVLHHESDATFLDETVKKKQEILEQYHASVDLKRTQLLTIQDQFAQLKQNTDANEANLVIQMKQCADSQLQLNRLNMENEELLSLHASTHNRIVEAEEKFKAHQIELASISSNVDAKLGEIRTSLLCPFSLNDAERLAGMISDNISRLLEKEDAQFRDFEHHAREKAKVMEQRYDDLLHNITTKLHETLQQKEHEYTLLVAELNKTTESKRQNEAEILAMHNPEKQHYRNVGTAAKKPQSKAVSKRASARSRTTQRGQAKRSASNPDDSHTITVDQPPIKIPISGRNQSKDAKDATLTKISASRSKASVVSKASQITMAEQEIVPNTQQAWTNSDTKTREPHHGLEVLSVSQRNKLTSQLGEDNTAGKSKRVSRLRAKTSKTIPKRVSTKTTRQVSIQDSKSAKRSPAQAELGDEVHKLPSQCVAPVSTKVNHVLPRQQREILNSSPSHATQTPPKTIPLSSHQKPTEKGHSATKKQPVKAAKQVASHRPIRQPKIVKINRISGPRSHGSQSVDWFTGDSFSFD